jgi:organic hydroperoxide reductase OsmC/OhrA
MATYTATITWARGAQPFTDGQYSRAHELSFDGGTVVPGSSSPHVVKLPLSREDAVDPEEMLVASLSACHMLFVLDFARRAGFVVDSYVDSAEGVMGKDERGRIAVTQVKLNPIIEWGGEKRPAPEEVRELHHKAHEACFIANSFRGDIAIGGGEAH